MSYDGPPYFPDDYEGEDPLDGESLEEAAERAQDHSTRAENDWAEYGPNEWAFREDGPGYSDDPPSEITEVAPADLYCDIVFGFCLTHQCPSWQCDER